MQTDVGDSDRNSHPGRFERTRSRASEREDREERYEGSEDGGVGVGWGGCEER